MTPVFNYEYHADGHSSGIQNKVPIAFNQRCFSLGLAIVSINCLSRLDALHWQGKILQFMQIH